MASPSFDVTSLYNSSTLSDITITFSGRKVKCHKIVLIQGSGYFQALCGPDGRFAERSQKVVELKEDDPDAVEMMLRHFYNFQYDTYKDLPHGRSDTKFHMSVYLVAKKYIVDKLCQEAFEAILGGQMKVRGNLNDPEREKEVTAVLERVKVLDRYRDESVLFGQLCDTIMAKHSGDLLTLPEFRIMLGEKQNKRTLNYVIEAVKIFQQTIQSPSVHTSRDGKCAHFECMQCAHTWIVGQSIGCPGCGNDDTNKYKVTKWRQIGSMSHWD